MVHTWCVSECESGVGPPLLHLLHFLSCASFTATESVQCVDVVPKFHMCVLLKQYHWGLDRGDRRGEDVGDSISTMAHMRISKHLRGKIVGKNIEELCCKNEGLYNG